MGDELTPVWVETRVDMRTDVETVAVHTGAADETN